MCAYNKHSDKHQEHSEFCDALCKDIEAFVRTETQQQNDMIAELGEHL